MITLGVILLLVSAGTCIFGAAVNSDTELRVKLFFDKGISDPGTSLIVIGTVIGVIGLVLIIAGIAAASTRKRGASPYIQVSVPTAPAMVPCKFCGAMIAAGSKFCNNCGKSLCCPKCGAPLTSGSKFCGSCGANLTVSQ